MPRIGFWLLLFASLLATPVHAVYTTGYDMNNGYDITPPTDSDIPNWTTGWGATNDANGITGWNYVGQVAGASGVYIGNGWVLTAAHVGGGDFVLGTTTYTETPGSGRLVTPNNANGTSEDLYVFQIEAPPVLPSLTLSLALPVAFSSTRDGSLVAMLGFGGASGPSNSLSWGLDTVTETNQTVDLTQNNPSYPYVSNDFFTDNGTVNRGSSSITNNSSLVSGDSGGGDFTYNPATGLWELTGINEIMGSYSNYSGSFRGNGTLSGMVQLDTYAAQIDAITGINVAAAPEPQTWTLLGLGLAFIWAYSRRRFPHS